MQLSRLCLAGLLTMRREYLSKHVPKCPSCGETVQIQLVHYHERLAQWKCRICKHKFAYEPE